MYFYKYKKYKSKYKYLKDNIDKTNSLESIYEIIEVGEEKDIEIPYNDHFKIKIAKNDLVIRDYLKRGYLFEKYVTMTIYAFCKKNDIIMDVGANVGCVTIPCAKWFIVHAFEPFAINFKALNDNTILNNVENNTILYNNAVGHKNMETQLSSNIQVPDSERKISTKKIGPEKINYGGIQLGESGQKITMITLDSLMDKINKVSLIKVDVEGAESLVFYGARNIIKKDRPIIIFEKNWQNVTEEMKRSMNLSEEVINFDIVKYCKDLGYNKMIYLHLEDYVLVPPERERVFFDKLLVFDKVEYLETLKRDNLKSWGMELYRMRKIKWD